MSSTSRFPLRTLAWTTALILIAASALALATALNVMGEPPERAIDSDLAQYLLTVFAWERDRLPLTLGAAVLFAVGFLGVAVFGNGYRRGAGDDNGWGPAVSAAFLATGILGAGSQLVRGAAMMAAGDPTYCDCGYLAEEVIGRLQAINLSLGVNDWLLYGAFFAAAAALLATALMPHRARAGTVRDTLAVVGALLLVAALGTRIAEIDPLPDILVLVAGGAVIPAWLVLAARDASDPAPSALARDDRTDAVGLDAPG